MKLFLLLILLMGVSISTQFTVYGDSHDSEEERELEIGVYDDYVEILSAFENETMSNEFEIRADTQGGEGHLTIELEYRVEFEIEGNITEFEFEMSVVYLDLFEFVDENEDGVYDIDDTIVKTLQLGDQGVVYYESPSSSNINLNDVVGHEFVLKGNISGVLLTISALIFNTDVSVQGVELEPTQTKITIEIENFMFEQTNTLLALRTEARTTTEFEFESQGDNAVEIESEIFTAGYSISETADINGVNQNVGVSFATTDGSTFLYSAYPQGNVYHDPVLGVAPKSISVLIEELTTTSINPTEDTNGDSSLSFNFLLISLMLLVPTSIYVNKRR